jgi:HSP20 family protein
MSQQWNPLQDLMLLQDRMNRLFEDATQRRTREADAGSEIEHAEWYPAADVYENDGEYTVAMDLPGIERSALEISIDDNRLAIRGTRVVEDTPAHRSERPSGRFLRIFNVPAAVNQPDIQAEYKDGVLQVHLPKRTEQKTQRVEIRVS